MIQARKFAAAAATGAIWLALAAAPVQATPVTLNLTGTVTEATGTWSGDVGTGFSADLTFDLDETNAYAKEFITPAGEDPFWRWTFHSPSGTAFDPYGSAFSGAFGSFARGTVWIETYNDFDADANGNPFGMTGIVDGVLIAGSNVVVDCSGGTVDPVTGCDDPNAPLLQGDEFAAILIGAQDWLADGSTLPTGLPAAGLLGIFGEGERILDGEPVASLQVQYNSIAPVPLPAALPLYGAGVALVGVIGWRRKRAARSA